MTTNIDPLRSGARAGAAAPDEVQADIAAASRTWHTLRAGGRELRFDEDSGGRVRVTMHRLSGERIAILDLRDMYTLIQHEQRD